MRVLKLHEWEVSTARAREIQLSLAKRVVTENGVISPRLVAGIDISGPDTQGVASGAQSNTKRIVNRLHLFLRTTYNLE